MLAGFVHLLRENKLLLLFLVSAIGYLVGRVKIGSFSLGVAAVLFVGLGFGALDRELNLPELVYQFGLVLTVRIGAKFVGKKASDARRELGGSLLFARLKRGGLVSVCYDDTTFQDSDLVSLVGAEKDLERAANTLGSVSDEHLELDRTVLDFRRVFISNK